MLFRVRSMCSLALAAMLLTSLPALAARKSGESAITATTPEAFAEQAQGVRKEMEKGGRYEGISSSNRQKVDAQLDFIGKLLTRRGSVDALNDQEKVDLMNAQEEANAILVGYDDQRLVCEYRKIAGSNRKEKVCQTKREIAAARDASQEAYRRQTSGLQNNQRVGGP